MFQWLTVVETLGYILIFPGFLFCFLVGLFLAGVDRKIVAKMQKRVGPPVLQPFYDFFKLCGKETIVPAAANKGMFLAAPLVGLAALIVLQMFIPVFSFSAFSTMADVIVILYLLLIPALSMILGGAASGSPYAGVGLSREMVTVIACELPLVLVLLAIAKAVGNATGSGLVFSMSEIIRYQLGSSPARPAATPSTRPRPRRRSAKACSPSTAARRWRSTSSATRSRCSRSRACLSLSSWAASAAVSARWWVPSASAPR